jgi:hypothetical protein
LSTAHSKGHAIEGEVLDPRDEDGAITPFTSTTTQMVRGEVDSQIATARQYPRSIKTFLDDARSMACIAEDTAASCFYKLKRKGKDGTKVIEGGSIRFAEIIANAYGNLRVQSRTTHEDDRFVYVMGTCWDVQKNVGFQVETRRRITDSNGRRYNEDMVGVTANAAGSIARRNAIFSVVPRALWEPILNEAKQVAVGTADTLNERRQKLVEYFGKMGVTPAQLAGWLEIESLDTLTLDGLEDLRGLATALKEGSAKLDEEFPPEKPEPKDGEKTEKTVPQTLDQVVQQQKTEPAKAEPAAAEPAKAEQTMTLADIPKTEKTPQTTPEPAQEPDNAAIDREIAQREGLPLGEPTEPAKGKKGQK